LLVLPLHRTVGTGLDESSLVIGVATS